MELKQSPHLDYKKGSMWSSMKVTEFNMKVLEFFKKVIKFIVKSWRTQKGTLAEWHSVCFQYLQVLAFSFYPTVMILSWFGSSIPIVICFFQFFIIIMAIFSMPSSIPIYWLDTLVISFRGFSSFSFLWIANVFYWDLGNLLTHVYFLRLQMNGIIIITNNDAKRLWLILLML